MTTPSYNVLIGHPIQSDVSVQYSPVFLGGSWLDSLPLVNLQDRRLARVARSTSAAIADTRFRCDLKTDRSVRAACLPKHSISSAGKVRVLGVPSSLLFDYEAGDDVVALGGTFARVPTATVLSATYVDSNGVVRYAGENRILRSDDFNNASWTKSNVTIAADSIANPYDATVTGDTLTASAGNGTAKQGVTTTAVSWTFSVWLKRKTGTGNVDITMDGTTWVTKVLTTNWQRFQVTQAGVAGTSNPGIRIVTNADAVYAWGAQAEIGTAATPYVPTTSAMNGAIRDGHFIGGYRHTLLEGASNNCCLQSENFGVTWATAGTPTRVAAAHTAAGVSLDLIGDDAVGAQEYYLQFPVFTGNGVKAISVFLKEGTSPAAGGSQIYFGDITAVVTLMAATVTWVAHVPSVAMATGTYVGYQALADGVYRLLFVSLAVTAAHTHELDVIPAIILAQTGNVYAGGVQCEDLNTPSSYIKTTAAAVARGDETLSFPYAPLPQSVTVFASLVELTKTDAIDGGGFVQLGTGAGAALDLYRKTVGLLRMDQYNGASNSSATVAGVAAVGDLVEARGVAAANGAATAGFSLNGGAEVTGSAGANAFPASYPGAVLYVGGDGLGASTGLYRAFGAYRAVRIAAGVQTLAYMRSIVYDSGWLNQYPAGQTAETLAGMNIPHLVLPASTQTAFRYCSVQIDDTANVLGYVDVGRLMVCGGWQSSINLAPGAQLGLEDLSTRTDTDGGAAVFNVRAVRRVLKFQILDLTDDEALTNGFDLQRLAGTHRQLLFVWNPTDTTHLFRRAMAIALRTLSPLEAAYFNGNNLAFEAVEEL